jgi:chromate transporter
LGLPADFAGRRKLYRHPLQGTPRVEKKRMTIVWANCILFVSVALGAAILGHFTRSMPILLFENFYRNGSLIFGGGKC